MDYGYTQLLRRAKERLPKAEEQERWDVPKADMLGSGRRSVIRNFSDICKALRRGPMHLAKYLFKELAVPGNVEGGQLFLQGKFGSELINRRIADYVKDFVLCHECQKPDTDIVKVGRVHLLKCQACGAHRPVEV